MGGIGQQGRQQKETRQTPAQMGRRHETQPFGPDCAVKAYMSRVDLGLASRAMNEGWSAEQMARELAASGDAAAAAWAAGAEGERA